MSSDSAAGEEGSAAVAREHHEERAAKRCVLGRVILMLSVCWVLELGGRFADNLNVITAATRDFLGVASMGLLGLSFLYVLSQVRRLPALVHRLLILACFFLVLFQLGDIADEFDSLRNISFLGKDQLIHRLAENTVAVTGGLLVIAGLYYALFELEWGRRRLDLDREQLAENVAVRQRVEQELKEAKDRLEAQVLERTAELAERNVQLRVELEERARAEESLAQRLRYEEALAGCSQALQTDSGQTAAMCDALEYLRLASVSARARLFEVDDSNAANVSAHVSAQACAPGIPVPRGESGGNVVFAGDLIHVRAELAKGRSIAGPVNGNALTMSILEEFNAKSILLIPVVWDSRWRGFLSFEGNDPDRRWSREEIRLLQTAADMLGAFMERCHAADALRRAHEDLERRVAERTADLTLANNRLQQEVADRRRAEMEKEKLEALLRQAEKMKAIGTLAGGIAHDFNNILSSIIGFTEMALIKSDPDFPYRRYLEEVFKAGNRAKELVRQILVFSRQSDEERVPVNMHEIVDEALALFAPSLAANIRVDQQLDPDCGSVLADPVQMHQVIMNLLSNAEHAMRDTGGVLDVRVESVRVDSTLSTAHGILIPGTYVLLTVSDTGHGMSAQTLQRIYEPFFTTKPVGEGTGMGLSIVHGIVSSLGGVITAESDFMQGATFRVYLPRHHREARPEKIDMADSQRGTEHILVVDDEPQLVSMWTEMLRSLGYQVSAYTSSPAALREFERAPAGFDLALVDQTMPQISGASLAQRMLELRPGFPIILATGFSESVSPEDARAMGIRDYIYKPIISKDLFLAIRKALGGVSTPSA